jgi:hypothetical protein
VSVHTSRIQLDEFIGRRAGRSGTRDGGTAASESADGQTLFYTSDRSAGLWQMPSGGGLETKVLDSVANRNFVAVRAGIYFMYREGGGASFGFLDFASGHVRTLGSTMRKFFNGLSVSPDERWLAHPRR